MAFSSARLNAAIDAALSGVDEVRLHTGDPGAVGTSNAAAGVDPATPTGVGGATGQSDTITGTWDIPGAGGPYTHASLWAAGTFAGSGALTPAETFAGAGTLDFTINVTAS